MKVFALVFAGCIIGAFATAVEEQKKYIEECITESGVERVVVEKLKENVWTMNDPKFQCFVKCMMMKTNAIKDDESFDVEVLKKPLLHDYPADKVAEIAAKCMGLPAASLCEKALKIGKCFFDHVMKTLAA